MTENEDYQLVPSGDDLWHIRMLKGEFVETVFSFGSLQVSADGENLTYDFAIEYTPDDELHVTNENFQAAAGKVLTDILENVITKES